jgi:hypothetical protein
MNMPTPLARFEAEPTPQHAVDFAIEAHTRFALRSGTPFNTQYIAVLKEVKAIIRANAARNRKTGGKA